MWVLLAWGSWLDFCPFSVCFLIYFWESCIFWISLSYVSFAILPPRLLVLQYSWEWPPACNPPASGFWCWYYRHYNIGCLLTVSLILVRSSLLVFLSQNVLLFKYPAGCGGSPYTCDPSTRGEEAVGFWIQSFMRLHETLKITKQIVNKYSVLNTGIVNFSPALFSWTLYLGLRSVLISFWKV